MTKNTCRAKNPATCRTHGQHIRTELREMTNVFSEMPRDYTAERAIRRIHDLNINSTRFSPDTLRVAEQTITDAFQARAKNRSQLLSYEISGALNDKVTAAVGDLAHHKFDFSAYPGETLAARPRTAANSKGWYERQLWLRDNGVLDSTPDTVFGTKYVYCSQHLRAHAAGWCTVSIVDKAPLTATTVEAATDEARAKNFKIYGDPESEVEPVRGPAPLYGVDTARAVDNNRWVKTLPAEQQQQLQRLIRKAKKKDVLLTIENFRKAHETA